MVEPKTIVTGLSAGLSAVSKAVPYSHKLNEERKAGQNPYGVPDDLADSILDDALRRLGKISEHGSIWEKLKTVGEAAVTRPEMFQKPAVIEWLSISEVSSALKSLANARTFNSPVDEDEYQFLLDEFSRVTFDGIQVARSVVETAIAVLKVSLEQSPSDHGTQDHMAQLFCKSKKTISEHIRNIFDDGELDERVVVRKFRTTTRHGARRLSSTNIVKCSGRFSMK